MDTGWWRVLITIVIGSLVGLMFNILKERYKNRERVKTMLLNQKLRCYQLGDDGKGLLKASPQLSGAHVIFIDLDLKWINRSRQTVTIDQCWLVLQAGCCARQFPCINREMGEPFQYLKISAQDTATGKLTVRVDRYKDHHFLFFEKATAMRLRMGTSRGREWTIPLKVF